MSPPARKSPVRLCERVEGKELYRRLEDEAAFGGRDRAAAGKRFTLNRRKRNGLVTLAFGTYDPTHPEEHCLIHSDFQKVGIDKIFHYSLSTEPPQGKLEPHGHLARSWPTFEEQAVFMAEYFCDGYGDEYSKLLFVV